MGNLADDLPPPTGITQDWSCEASNDECRFLTWARFGESCCSGAEIRWCMRCFTYQCADCGKTWKHWKGRPMTTLDTGGLT